MRTRLALAILLSTLTASVASPQVPAGGVFQVNTYTTGDQQPMAVASDPFGNFVVVWTNAISGDLDVHARRFDASGNAQGPEFRVNTYTPGYQFGGAVGADRGGNFIVAWTSDGQDGDGHGVFARRFDAAGVPVGLEFQVNTYTSGAQTRPAVAIDAARNFVVAWSGAGTGDATGVFARRYEASGAPGTDEFLVNVDTSGEASSPAAAFDGSRRLIVSWSRLVRGVSVRRYDASGAPLGTEFRADTPDPWNLSFSAPVLAADQAGGFVVAWSRSDYWPPAAPAATRGPGESGVFGQMFDAAGAPRGAQITVQSSFRNPHSVSVAADAAGSFTVAWDRRFVSPPGVFAKRYDASGVLRGPEFGVGSGGVSQFGPMVASDGVGNLVFAWSQFSDGDRYGAFGQRFGGIVHAAAAVDTAASAGSDGNRVLEPGESVDVRPSWRNVNGAAQTFDGVSLGFTGPATPGVSYALLDGVGAYGAVANGATAQCSDCYGVGVAWTGARPALHWDASFTERLTPDALGQTMPWSLHVGQSFPDVPRASLFYRDVETLLHRGVTGGCTANAYCPGSPVTRDQMAAFVLVAKEGAGYKPRPCSPPNLFADVPETSLFCDVIEELARRGVVGGCGGGNYCPAAAVTREQMPVFVLRLLDPALDPPACTTPMFADVPAGSPFCRWIEELARRGVVAGCGGGNYCPSAPVTRDQMATFLTGTYGLTLYGP